MKLYFLRHGESQANVEVVYAAPDSPLTAKGREQAREAGIAAKPLGIGRIIASPYLRALDTARIVAGEIGFNELDIVEDSRLRELGVGNKIGTPSTGLAGYMAHQADPQGDSSVEPLTDVKQRLHEIIDSLPSSSDEVVLLASHSGLGIILQSMLSGVDGDIAATPNLPNAQIIELPYPGALS